MRPPLHDRRRPAPRRALRLSRPFAARCEALEPRLALTTTSALDPSFGSRGVVLGATSPSDTNLSTATAVAVQPDGKVVEVGAVGQVSATLNPGLAARRYNADGSLDTTFGTNGQVTIPYSATSNGFGLAPRNVVVEANGDIVFAAEAAMPVVGMSGIAPQINSVVVRLTPSGQLDPTFGTSGEYVVPQADGSLTSVAVQADGKVIVAGSSSDGTGTNGMDFSVIRLTTAGALDTAFNSTGRATVAFQTTGLPTSGLVDSGFAALALTPSGQILVAGNEVFTSNTGLIADSILAEFQGDGTLASSFGTGGKLVLTPVQTGTVGALAVQPDGRIVVAGVAMVFSSDVADPGTTLIRLTATGAVDPTFARVGPQALGTTIEAVDVRTPVAIDTDGKITVGEATLAGITSSLGVARYLSTGALDPTFGLNGRAALNITSTFLTGSSTTTQNSLLNDLAVTATGDVLVAGTVSTYYRDPSTGTVEANQGNQAFLARILPIKTVAVANDYDGDGKTDIAGVLGAFGLYAYRPSSGNADVLASFGPSTVGAAIPAPGDYDGDGKADIAAYFPAYGALVYRPSSGGADVVVPFGIPGAGNSIPAPGDYDGDGKTDPAVYLPALGILAYRPSSGGADVLIPFGIAGTGQSIPAPGDYDGDGKTDPAVYLENLGILAYRPSSGGADVLTQFGVAGGSIPAPGDYDGDGKTDLAVYIPALGDYAYRPSAGGADVITQFGIAGSGGSIPAPGDYDGDGRTDLAVYLPSIGYLAYRPSAGGADVLSQFGASGTMQTVPAASIPAAFASSATGTVSSSAAGGSVAVHDLALTDDLTSAEMVQLRRKHKAAT